MNRPELVDAAVVGGGIVGLATARALLQRRPGSSVVVLDKETEVAAHQSGRNSGVLHSGVYYAPGSAKARLCTTGMHMMLDYCRERGVPVQVGGKVIVAVTTAELGRLDELRRRATANGVPCELVGPSGLRQIEPHCRGIAALHVPGTGVTDFGAVCRALADDLRADGGDIRLGRGVHRVVDDEDGALLVTDSGEIRARVAVNCAGLHSDRLARLSGLDPAVGIVPFRGEYHRLAASAESLVRHLVYPVPDPRFPFLGVHLTRGVDGSVHAGPNALLALGRESYRGSPADPAAALGVLTDPAVRRLALRYWRTGAGELARSWSPHRLGRAVRGLVPAIGDHELRRDGEGIRAQAVTRAGRLVDDFVFERRGHVLHVLNAPSPAATASLAIGQLIAHRLTSE